MTTCNLCDSQEFSIISKKDRKGRPLTTAICEKCGLVSHLPIPTEKEISDYYVNSYRIDYHGERVPSARRILRAWKNGQRIFKQLQPFLPNDASVFEVGAGIGCSVKVFADRGYSASGIEPNQDFNNYTREVLQANVTNTSLYELTQKKQYNTILLVHVIEHFVSPKKALKHIYNLIENEGFLYVECPNLSAPFTIFDHLFHYAHIYNFSHNTLVSLARSCGFEVMQTFSDDNNPNIQILLKKAKPQKFSIPSQEALNIKKAIHKYGWISYHLRLSYLKNRFKKLLQYAFEALFAKKILKKII